MFRGIVCDSSPFPFSSFCSTPFLAQTLAEYFNGSQTPRCSARRSLPWLIGRAELTHMIGELFMSLSATGRRSGRCSLAIHPRLVHGHQQAFVVECVSCVGSCMVMTLFKLFSLHLALAESRLRIDRPEERFLRRRQNCHEFLNLGTRSKLKQIRGTEKSCIQR